MWIFNIDGYQWVADSWVSFEHFNILDPAYESKANQQVFHNGIRSFYYLKTQQAWVRAGLNESKALQWTLLIPGTYPRWALFGPTDPLLLEIKKKDDEIKELLLKADNSQPSSATFTQEIEYTGTLSPAYQNIVKASISHILEKPTEIDESTWKMILRTCLYPKESIDNIKVIQSNPELFKLYQGTVVCLMAEKINKYTFKLDENLPTIGQIYDYTAWLLSQKLDPNNTAPILSMTNPELAAKTVGEINSGEILVYRGFDPTQELLLVTLVNLFNDKTNAPLKLIKKLSLNEINALKDLLDAVRLSRPLNDWQSLIWDDFVIIASESSNTTNQLIPQYDDYTLEEFGHKLIKFKERDLSEMLQGYMANIQTNKRFFLNNLQHPGYIRTIMWRDNDILLNTLRSCTEDENNQIWAAINDEAIKFDASSRISPIYTAFNESCTKEKWLERIQNPGVLELIEDLIQYLPIGREFITTVQWLPNLETKKRALLERSKSLAGIDITEFACLIQEELDNELFEAIFFKEDFLNKLNRTNLFYIFNLHLNYDQRVRILSYQTSLNLIIQNRASGVALLKWLNSKDQINLLKTERMQSVCAEDRSTTPFKDFIESLKTETKEELINTEVGRNILVKYTNIERDLHHLLNLAKEKSDKVHLIHCFLIDRPGYFFTTKNILKDHRLDDEFLKSLVALSSSSINLPFKDDEIRTWFELGLSYYLLSYAELTISETNRQFKILVNGEFQRPRIAHIMKNIDPSLRKEFIFNENIMKRWIGDEGYGPDSFPSLIRNAFQPGPVFDKDELHKLSTLFERPEHINYIASYTTRENYLAFKEELETKKRQTEEAKDKGAKRRRNK